MGSPSVVPSADGLHAGCGLLGFFGRGALLKPAGHLVCHGIRQPGHRLYRLCNALACHQPASTTETSEDHAHVGLLPRVLVSYLIDSSKDNAN